MPFAYAYRLRRGEAYAFRITDKIAVRIRVPVEALAVGNRTQQYVLIDESLQVRAIVSGSHLIETVRIGYDTVLSVVQESGKLGVSLSQFSVCAVRIPGDGFPADICQRSRASQMIEMVGQVSVPRITLPTLLFQEFFLTAHLKDIHIRSAA